MSRNCVTYITIVVVVVVVTAVVAIDENGVLVPINLGVETIDDVNDGPVDVKRNRRNDLIYVGRLQYRQLLPQRRQRKQSKNFVEKWGPRTASWRQGKRRFFSYCFYYSYTSTAWVCNKLIGSFEIGLHSLSNFRSGMAVVQCHRYGCMPFWYLMLPANRKDRANTSYIKAVKCWNTKCNQKVKLLFYNA